MNSTSEVTHSPASGNAGVRLVTPQETQAIVAKSLRRRYWAERRFRAYGAAAVLLGVLFVLFLFTTIFSNGVGAFQQAQIQLDVFYDPELIDPAGTRAADDLAVADYGAILRASLQKEFPEVAGRRDKRELARLLSSSAPFVLQERVQANPALIGTRDTLWVIASDAVDLMKKEKIDRSLPAEQRPLSDQQLAWFDALTERGDLELKFNRTFFTTGDSRDPENAGVWGAVMGSVFMLLLTLLLSFPIGVATAIYLEEFAPRNRWTDIIEVNINNLAAVPSIVFGLLGLAVFINFFELPRSSPLVGGLVLALMTLPVIIIAGRSALKSVPPSIREGALGVGASPMQTVLHHVLPLAMPGMMTGAIIGMARALGESAPLLMIGMVAFIVDIPHSTLDPATVLPVQIYLWADSPERAFVERTSAAIIVLLVFLILMNGLAVYLRRRYERRW